MKVLCSMTKNNNKEKGGGERKKTSRSFLSVYFKKNIPGSLMGKKTGNQTSGLPQG